METTLDDEVQVWQNPEDEYQAFFVGDIFESFAVRGVLLSFLADLEDGKNQDKAINDLSERCEDLGISPDPCPMCGRYSEHSHSME